MIKPEDFKQLAIEYSNVELSKIEEEIDAEIKKAIARGQPVATFYLESAVHIIYSKLTLKRLRDELLPRYRAAGWVVTQPENSDESVYIGIPQNEILNTEPEAKPC